MTSISKVALIIGITGQDGSYLAEFQTEKGYAAHDLARAKQHALLKRQGCKVNVSVE